MPKPKEGLRQAGRDLQGGFRTLTVLAALVLLAAPACGPQRLTKAEFLQQGDRLCRQFEKESRTVQLKNDPFQPGAPPEDLQAAPRFLNFFAANLPQLAGDLEGLGPPPDDRRLLNRTIRILNESGQHFARAGRSFQAGDHAAAKKTLDSAYGRLEEAGRLAQQYGFKDCGSPSTQSAGGKPAPAGPEVPVTAADYSFQMPAELPPGPHTFVIKNEGRERHFLALRRLKPGIGFQRLLDSQIAGEPIADLIEQDFGQSGTALPGQTVKFNADLPAGNYAYACFIAAPDGQLHAYKGMSGQLTVESA